MNKLRLISFTTAVISLIALTPAFAQDQATVGQIIGPGDLAIDQTPESFVFTAIYIDSPQNDYYSIYINPLTDPDTALKIHDGRYSGGFELSVQSDDYVDDLDPEKTISNENLMVVTSDTTMNEVTLDTTPAITTPLEDDPSLPASYDGKTLDTAQVILQGTAASGIEGRVGTYTTYPSFKMKVPVETAEGNYSNTITYTLTDSSI